MTVGVEEELAAAKEKTEQIVDIEDLAAEGILVVAAALMRAQAKYTPVLKDASNPAYKKDGKESKYATLDSVISAVRPALQSEGLIIIQKNIRNNNEVGVYTRLVHTESGEELTSSLTAPPDKFNSQGIGSVLTYLRRYEYLTIAGVAPEDDDGNAGSGKNTESGQAKAEPRSHAPAAAKPTLNQTAPKPETTLKQMFHNDGLPPAAATKIETTVFPPSVNAEAAALPTDAQYITFTSKAKSHLDTLKNAGLAATGKNTVNNKLKEYILYATQSDDLKKIPIAKWELFLAELQGVVGTDPKLAVQLIERANTKEATSE